ncbi:NAD(P)-binding domain-containing protein [Streptomyces sp. IB2014 016-6]|nr:NAD(P)-binding domain-containing protein [Streptomyces sp. IB2014 016-6]TXL90491.1 NAD(P)-dependent oxidoreductase [Streptomyces sp. IB2014 016-6]
MSPTSTANPTPAVSVIGLGMMGTALAAAFLKAGHPVTVWNRTPARTGPLVAQGATPADTAAEAVAASPLIVVCLTTYDTVRTVLEPLAGQLTGKTLANLTNGTPEQARDLAAWAAREGAGYLDGGIMAVPQMIAGPHAYVLYSGARELFDAHRETLAALGGTKYVGTDPGLAALYDLALLTGMYGMTMGVMQAYALIGTESVPATEFSELLVPWVGAMLGSAPAWAAAIDSGRHLTDVSSLAVNQEAFPNLLAAFAAQGVSTELFAPVQPLLDRAVAEGHAADGLSRLADLLRSEPDKGSSTD